MFRKYISVLIVFMFSAILLSNNVVLAHAQIDDFPIGLNVTYVIGFDRPQYHYEYQNTYDFIQWIHQDNLTIEYEIDQVTLVKPFPEIHLQGPDQPPLWMDVSSWSVHDTIYISGIGHPIIIMEDYWVPGVGTFECFRLESVVVANGRENATSFWYHAQLGLLVDYLRVDLDIPSNEMIVAYTDFVILGNFDQFNPPTFTVQQPTQTTTTTTTTTTIPELGPTTPPDSTTTTTSATSPFDIGSTDAVLAVAILVEIIIIAVIISQRK